jgi:hypothetical protein
MYAGAQVNKLNFGHYHVFEMFCFVEKLNVDC